MDQIDRMGASRLEMDADSSAEAVHNDTASRLLAYTSPYLFWVVVVAISAGLLFVH